MQILIDIDATGEVTIEPQGVSGPGCRVLTEAIERAIGATTCDTTKPELWAHTQQEATNRLNAES